MTTVAAALVLGADRVSGPGRAEFSSTNPARTSDIVGVFPQADAEDTCHAVDAAVAAAGGWADSSSIDRGSILFRAAELLDARDREATDLVVREVGKTRPEAAGEVRRAVGILRYYAGLGSAASGEMYPGKAARSFVYSAHRPLGPTAVITPWNFPLAIPLWKIAPALVYGNTVVFKPAEEGSAVAWLLTEVLLDAGLPDGVLNVLYGDGEVIGEALLAHPGLRGLTFTGSTEVGRRIERTAVHGGLKVQLELGGSNATIVLDDAAVDSAADVVVGAAMKFAGQKCTATSRVIATPGVYASLREAVVDRVRTLRVGDPSRADDVDVGPVISAAAQRNVVDGVRGAVAAGARLLAGGDIPRGNGVDDGFFVSPTVVDRVQPDSPLGQEELFGPVVSFFRADNVDDAVRLANQVRYGLAAAVLTNDLDKALRCADSLDVGVVKLNSETTGLEPHVPFGGLKDSGSHFPEQGTAARAFFTRTTTVYVEPGA
ncbi:MAG TPA: aldehyde dehydrogenase family protein [Amycolatopsis sp.]|nr:aldehyde dehydrogenase family protein [Amycolatopsis sp.]